MHGENKSKKRLYTKYNNVTIDEVPHVLIDYHGLYKNDLESLIEAFKQPIKKPCIILDLNEIQGDNFHLPILFGNSHNFTDHEFVKRSHHLTCLKIRGIEVHNFGSYHTKLGDRDLSCAILLTEY